jgi:cytoskeletal protein CcmA (bactofilin family)
MPRDGWKDFLSTILQRRMRFRLEDSIQISANRKTTIMFSTKAKAKTTVFPGQTSIIGSEMEIHGELTVNADIRIDGKLIGNITSSARVVLGSGGIIEGNVIAQRADINGKVYGNITVKDLLNLKAEADVKGDITAGKVGMDSTVQFNGNCRITGTQLPIKLIEEKPMQAAV